jgi:cell division transport system permease protein
MSNIVQTTVSNMVLVLLRDIRIAQRVILETFGGLSRTGWMNVLIIITMASILTIFGSLFVLVEQSKTFVNTLGSNMEMSIYLKDSAEIGAVQEDLDALPQVAQLEVVTKQEAWEKMRESYPDFPEIQNPLPNTIHLQPTSPNDVPALKKELANIEGIQAVKYPFEVLKKIQLIAKGLSVFGTIFTVFLGILTLFIISNTLSLLIQARGREIEILRMMGITNWYIRLPFLFQGVLYGLSGALIAYFPVSLVQQYSLNAFSFFHLASNSQHLTVVTLLMVGIGTLVGGSGAIVSMRKYLKI